MSALSNSLLVPNQSSYGSSLKSLDQSSKLLSAQSRVGNAELRTSKRMLSIQARYSDDERSSHGSAFVGGFVLGGLIIGTLGCVYAPQISKALSGTDKKELLKKLPTFIYDEEKALEKTRKKLTEKIAQLNDAIDDVSLQLKSDDEETNANGAVVPEKSESVA
ncbi:hypothetical protein CTI12_AA059870 [Artemisia annua]|uniref:Localized to the inner membrane of the chloroplast n=2 Tax=Artemisia annua TaxID=35608 RepID=A0A2U1Q8M4_ARTAN|nr:hypothetical protein CTI12_AA059870 [Artemisia annua]